MQAGGCEACVVVFKSDATVEGVMSCPIKSSVGSELDGDNDEGLVEVDEFSGTNVVFSQPAYSHQSQIRSTELKSNPGSQTFNTFFPFSHS